MREIQDLISISQFYGKDSRFVIAGGGNTSYKNDEKIGETDLISLENIKKKDEKRLFEGLFDYGKDKITKIFH